MRSAASGLAGRLDVMDTVSDEPRRTWGSYDRPDQRQRVGVGHQRSSAVARRGRHPVRLSCDAIVLIASDDADADSATRDVETVVLTVLRGLKTRSAGAPNVGH